jgi:adenylate kinase family enzyme
VADRIAVHGPSGSGKTSLAVALADRLDLPRTELDAHFHQPGWTPLDTDSFRARVGAVVAGDRWVIDGNYHQVRDLVWARADLVVLFDLPRWTVMGRLVRRSVTRAAIRRELWNGNRESFRNLMSTDADRNVVLWSWRSLRRYHDTFAAEVEQGAPQAELVVLSRRGDADRLVEQLVGRRSAGGR